MRQTPLAASLCLSLVLTACQIVPNPDPADEAAVPQTDEARMAAYTDEVWEAQVLPVISSKVVA